MCIIGAAQGVAQLARDLIALSPDREPCCAVDRIYGPLFSIPPAKISAVVLRRSQGIMADASSSMGHILNPDGIHPFDRIDHCVLHVNAGSAVRRGCTPLTRGRGRSLRLHDKKICDCHREHTADDNNFFIRI